MITAKAAKEAPRLAMEAWPANVPPQVRRSVELIAGALDAAGLFPRIRVECRSARWRRSALEVLRICAGAWAAREDEWNGTEIQISTDPALPAGQYILVCVRPDGSAYDASEPDAPDFLQGQTLTDLLATA